MTKTRIIHATDAVNRIARTLNDLDALGIDPDEIHLPVHEAIALSLIASEVILEALDSMDDPDLGPYYAPGQGPVAKAANAQKTPAL
jgi:hypothetical protein